MIKHTLMRLAKQLQFHTPLRNSMVHRYDYFFWPEELSFLARLMEASVRQEGCVVEIGCAQGATTVYLNKHLEWAARYQGLRKDVRYACFDTFSGFVADHVAHEQAERGKGGESFNDYRINSPEWFRHMLHLNGYPQVEVHQGDAAKFDWAKVGPIGFCLLDVDLYVPTKAILPEVHRRLAPGGVIVVDDCQPAQRYDGARQAYVEFMASLGREPDIHHRKFGIIRADANEPPAQPL